MPRPPFVLLASAAASAAVGAGAAEAQVRRRIARAVAETRAQVTVELAGAAPSAEQLREELLVEVLSERPEPPWRIPAAIVSDLIWARLTQEDIAAVEAVMEGDPADLWEQSDETARRRLALNYIAYYHQWEALERTGVRHEMPPDEVHAMARGALAAGGDPFLADLVFEAVFTAGLTVPEGGTVLDFGASSGRVLRMIAAARPDLRCLGCDPNAEAIVWATEHLAMAEFFVSPQAPPLDLPDASVDMAYAISVWSHFDQGPARAWLDELHRVLKPGGALVLTTHGFDCLAVQVQDGRISAQTATRAAAAMIRDGHFFVDVFGEAGDWGVRDAGWGNAYLTLDWLQSAVGGRFATRLLWPGFLDRVQDVVVLERR